MQSAVLAMIDSVCLSVCLSVYLFVTVRYHRSKCFKLRSCGLHWTDWRIAPWLYSFLAVITSPRNSKGNVGSEGAEWERGKKNRQFLANKSPYLRNAAREDHSYNDRLIVSRICAFDSYQNHRPLMTLNGRNKASFAAYCTNLNESIPMLSATKM